MRLLLTRAFNSNNSERLAGIQIDPGAGEVPTWTGPHLFLLIDDYDLVVASQGNPMPALHPTPTLPIQAATRTSPTRATAPWEPIPA